MSPALSMRIGQILGHRTCTAAQREAVIAAAEAVETWEELPVEIRQLLARIEAQEPN